MATKGPSNKYGNGNGSATTKINYPYVVPKYIGSNPKDHMEKHFSDFNVDNATDYIAKAVNFGNDIDRVNYDSFVDHNGTTYKYNKLNNALIIVSKEGNIITYFKPRYERGPKKGQLNWNYFNSQRKEKIDNERQFGKR